MITKNHHLCFHAPFHKLTTSSHAVLVTSKKALIFPHHTMKEDKSLTLRGATSFYLFLTKQTSLSTHHSRCSYANTLTGVPGNAYLIRHSAL